MVIPTPVYHVQISGSVAGVKHDISSAGSNEKRVNSISVKPGLTKTLGSFEIELPDSTGSCITGSGVYNDVSGSDDVRIWFGWDTTGSTIDFAGKIEVVQPELNSRKGYITTISGRDYGECLARVLVNRGFVNNSGDTVIQSLRNACTGSTTGGLSTSTGSMAGDVAIYNLVMLNEPVFRGMQTIANIANMDFYIGVDKVLNYFNRQSRTGAETFGVGTNILEYKVTKDIDPIKNDIYIFGRRDSNSISGSDIPTSHDSYTEADTGGWSGWCKSGSGPATGSTNVTISSNSTTEQTGSACIQLQFSVIIGNGGVTDGEFYLRKTLPSTVSLLDGDFIHLYWRHVGDPSESRGVNPSIRLETSASNYFECKAEREASINYDWENASSAQLEKTIYVGPSHEGVSTTGSADSFTGSYRWTRVGDPDWLNITSISIYGRDVNWATALQDNYTYVVDGVYLGTEFQGHESGSSSINDYGLRRHVEIDNKYNSDEYCTSRARTITGSLLDPVTQVSLSVTGSTALSMGTKYKLTIPNESIVNSYYELIDLEHKLTPGRGFVTDCVLTDKREIRTIMPILDYPTQVAEERLSWWETLLKILGRAPYTGKYMPAG